MHRRLALIGFVLAMWQPAAAACTTLQSNNEAEERAAHESRIASLAENFVDTADDAEVIFFGRITAVRRTEGGEVTGGLMRHGWKATPGLRIWLTPTKAVRGEIPQPFSVYRGEYNDYHSSCGWNPSEFVAGEIALVAAERKYAGNHWFGEVISNREFDDLLPALEARGLSLPSPRY